MVHLFEVDDGRKTTYNQPLGNVADSWKKNSAMLTENSGAVKNICS
jgi:hypothetical protein